MISSYAHVQQAPPLVIEALEVPAPLEPVPYLRLSVLFSMGLYPNRLPCRAQTTKSSLVIDEDVSSIRDGYATW